MEFKNFKFKEKCFFILYADTESLPKPNDMKIINSTNTSVFQHHEIFSIGFYLKCFFDENLSEYWSYKGTKASEWFAGELQHIAKKIDNIYKNEKNVMRELTSKEVFHYKNSQECHICRKK